MDRGAFTGKYAAVERGLRAYLHASCGNFIETEDLLQNVWRVVWEKLDAYDDNRPFEGWVMGIARLEVLKWRSRQARNRVILSEEAVSQLAETAIDETSDLSERHRCMIECLQQLQGQARRLLDMKYFERLSIRVIADKLDRNVAAVEMQLVRVRRVLKECIHGKMCATGE